LTSIKIKFLTFGLIGLILSGQSAHAFARKHPLPTPTPKPVSTPAPTPTPRPSATPIPIHTPVPVQTPVPVATATPVPAGDTSTNHKAVYDQFISVFENSTLVLPYAAVESLNDGRGYTAGRAGFTSRDGDMLWVVEDYLTVNPSSAFSTLLSTLKTLSAKGSGSTSGLSTLPSIWKSASNDINFRNSQDKISDQQYYNPAVAEAKKYEITSPIGILCLYDSAIEHGIDGDDGVDDMISRMPARATFATEYDWIRAFLAVRRNTLLHPKDSSTQQVWSESVGRVDTLLSVLNSGNYTLITPITINPFGDEFVVGSGL
jgi:chitosanase